MKAAWVSRIEPIAIVAGFIALWDMTHRYIGLGGDGELYAVQAFARIHIGLANDLFLQSNSQDKYTLFSPLYAVVIAWFGIRSAAMILFILTKIGFIAASWALIRAFVNRYLAFVAVSLLVVLKGNYGAFSVFHYTEDFVTARSVAEALVVTALALHCHGYKISALLLTAGALFIHPLMALPCLLLLACFHAPTKFSVTAAISAVLLALGIAVVGAAGTYNIGLLAVVDATWLEVVRERSQFLFLQLWSSADWTLNCRPFLSLAITMLAINDNRVRTLCWASALVGATGLAIGYIAGVIGPVAILLQGQAWRWIWITSFISVALIVPTLVNVWRDERCGSLCATLIVLGWAFPVVNNVICLTPALLLWLMRNRLNNDLVRIFRWTTWGLILIASLWTIGDSWNLLSSPATETGRETLALNRIRNILGLQLSSIGLIWLLYRWLGWNKSLAAVVGCSAALGAAAAVTLPGSFVQLSRDGASSEVREFTAWRDTIPPSSNVYVVPAHNSATFAWFTLERPSYLSVDQSSGVVFSRDTALEVKRRSNVLLPVRRLDWTLLSDMRRPHTGAPSEAAATRPITRDGLTAICADAALGFVVAQEDVGFDPIKHTHAGNWKDWNLYDCRHIRSLRAQQ